MPEIGLDWSQVYDIPFDGCVQYLAFGAKEYLLDGGEANKGSLSKRSKA
jgi:hypothetical protein